MTEQQKELARHALGLPNKRRQSYRNRFVAGVGHEDHTTWLEMENAGCADHRDGRTLPFGGDDMFWLTLDGARLALGKRETLCPEDFPLAQSPDKEP
jgi:hypothetical protein